MNAADLIANATPRTDQRVRRADIDFAAQIIHVDVNDVRDGVGVHAPDLFISSGGRPRVRRLLRCGRGLMYLANATREHQCKDERTKGGMR